MAESFRNLIVWQRSVQMSVALYRLTGGFPREELYGLTSQLRRAGVSVASNIAEGWGRQSQGEYKHFLGMARGSNMEVQTQLVIASELGFGESDKRNHAEELSHEVGKMLVALMNKL
jgi:four helix bundle protein